MTRDDVIRRLAEALRAQGQPYVASVAGTLVQVMLDEQRALAREPGGAEAVAEAVELRAELVDDPVCLATESCECYARIVAAKEPTP